MRSLERDLKKIIKGEVFFDEVTRHIYSFGASIYKIKPKGVVIPRDKEDIVSLIRYAASENIPLTARGAGTSLAGQSVGSGIIVDFTGHMNRLDDYKGEDLITLDPGIVYGGLNKFLSGFGKFFPPDPSSGEYCTIGGMIANNSGGPHSVKYGSVADWCEELEVVLSTGELVTLKQDSKIDSISEPLIELFSRNEENIKRHIPRVKRSASGYNIASPLKGDGPNLVKLLVGSEGTLAVITKARLRLASLPRLRTVMLLFLDDKNAIKDAIYGLRQLNAAAVEFMDEVFVRLAREAEPRIAGFLPAGLKGCFLVEFEEETEDASSQKVKFIKEELVGTGKCFSGVNIAAGPADSDHLWAVRRAAVPIMNRIKGSKRPIAFIEDAIVPPEKLDEFVSGVYAIFERYSLEACVYGHAGDGNMHIRPLIDMKDKADLMKMEKTAADFYNLVASLGGSASAEHGDGILRSPYLKKQFGPLHQVFARIKHLFDPKGILNPGAKLGKEDSITHDLICDPQTTRIKTGTVFDAAPIQEEIERCHSCGLCRSVCPANISMPEECYSPRAKAALLKVFITGGLEKSQFLAPSVKKILDSCLNCRLCRIECPTESDIPLLCLLAKENYVKENGGLLFQQFIENMDMMGSLLKRYHRFSCVFLDSGIGKALIQLGVGIDKRRNLPHPSISSFDKKALNRKTGVGKVAYFYGCYVNYFNADKEGDALAHIMQKNGIEVFLPKQRCCGMPSVSSGNADAVRDSMIYNVKNLYEAVEEGFDIITSCPSCSLALRQDYPRILNTPEAAVISQRTFDALEYLWNLFNDGLLKTDFKTSNKKVTFHAPCHLKAQGAHTLQESLIRLVPGITVLPMEDSCCGMGGLFGLKKKNFDLSMAIGNNLFGNIEKTPVDEVITSCAACKMQIEQATSSKVVHPLEFLAGNYS